MNRILVRFNTKFEEDTLKRKWRLLIDGEEWLVHKVSITGHCHTIEETIKTGEIKYHIECYGIVSIDNNFFSEIRCSND